MGGLLLHVAISSTVAASGALLTPEELALVEALSGDESAALTLVDRSLAQTLGEHTASSAATSHVIRDAENRLHVIHRGRNGARLERRWSGFSLRHAFLRNATDGLSSMISAFALSAATFSERTLHLDSPLPEAMGWSQRSRIGVRSAERGVGVDAFGGYRGADSRTGFGAFFDHGDGVAGASRRRAGGFFRGRFFEGAGSPFTVDALWLQDDLTSQTRSNYQLVGLGVLVNDRVRIAGSVRHFGTDDAHSLGGELILEGDHSFGPWSLGGHLSAEIDTAGGSDDFQPVVLTQLRSEGRFATFEYEAAAGARVLIVRNLHAVVPVGTLRLAYAPERWRVQLSAGYDAFAPSLATVRSRWSEERVLHGAFTVSYAGTAVDVGADIYYEFIEDPLGLDLETLHLGGGELRGALSLGDFRVELGLGYLEADHRALALGLVLRSLFRYSIPAIDGELELGTRLSVPRNSDDPPILFQGRFRASAAVGAGFRIYTELENLGDSGRRLAGSARPEPGVGMRLGVSHQL